ATACITTPMASGRGRSTSSTISTRRSCRRAELPPAVHEAVELAPAVEVQCIPRSVCPVEYVKRHCETAREVGGDVVVLDGDIATESEERSDGRRRRVHALLAQHQDA